MVTHLEWYFVGRFHRAPTEVRAVCGRVLPNGKEIVESLSDLTCPRCRKVYETEIALSRVDMEPMKLGGLDVVLRQLWKNSLDKGQELAV